jgi:putative SOS response-associated peptidase YedK
VCNDFGNNVPYSAYLEAFSQIRVPVVFPTAAPNLEPRDDIWPTETAPVFRRREEGVELMHLRWGFPPGRRALPDWMAAPGPECDQAVRLARL